MQRGGLSNMYICADCSIANLPTAIYRVKQSTSRDKRESGWSAGSLPPIGVAVATGGLEHSLHRLTNTRYQLVPAPGLADCSGYDCRVPLISRDVTRNHGKALGCLPEPISRRSSFGIHSQRVASMSGFADIRWYGFLRLGSVSTAISLLRYFGWNMEVIP
jgi:hypothetical protein